MEVAGGFKNADYLLCWRINPFVPALRAVLEDYDVAHATKRFMVLRRRGRAR